jgi:hypothetical protein
MFIDDEKVKIMDYRTVAMTPVVQCLPSVAQMSSTIIISSYVLCFILDDLLLRIEPPSMKILLKQKESASKMRVNRSIQESGPR